MSRFRGFIVSVPRGTAFPGSDVRGFADFDTADPIALKNQLTSLVDSLKSSWDWIKLKIQAREVVYSYLTNVDSSVAGFQTIDNIIAMKYKSINDVLAGSTPLAKWLNGVDVARVEILSYADYVNDSASVKANLDQLGSDLKQTIIEGAKKAVDVAEDVGTGLAIATPILIAGVAFLLWKVGIPLLHTYLGGRAPRLGAYRRRRR